MNKIDYDKRVEKLNKLVENIQEFKNLVQEIQKDSELDGSYGLCYIKKEYLTDIYDHLRKKGLMGEILNADGDIFYISEKREVSDTEIDYIGRRVLWNFCLSEEEYEIEQTMVESDVWDDEYVVKEVNYKIAVLTE